MWTSNVLSSFSRWILQCDDLKEMALLFCLKDPSTTSTVPHVLNNTENILSLIGCAMINKSYGEFQNFSQEVGWQTILPTEIKKKSTNQAKPIGYLVGTLESTMSDIGTCFPSSKRVNPS